MYKLTTKTTNIDILNKEENGIYGGVCGNENGLLIDESLRIFFEKNDIEVIDENDDFIILKQLDNEFKIKTYMGTDGSLYLSKHCNFKEIEEL